MSHGKSHSPRTWLAIFQLCRIPALFSAWADILLGAGITFGHIDLLNTRILWLILSTTGLYLAGMVFNDIADRRIDLKESPQRPLPSGRISLNFAVRLALSLLSLGLIAASFAGPVSVSIALLIAVAAQSYNFILKGTLVGCFTMGLCRGLNLLLGASLFLTWPLVDSLPLSTALIYTLYVAGLTWFARQESETTIHRQELLGGIYLSSAARILWGLQILTRPFHIAGAIAFTLLTTISLRSVKRLVAISSNPAPSTVQQGVRSLLLVIIPQHALLLLGLVHDFWGALLILLLVIPARRLSRFMAIT